jgi:PAS domain S-box-containing protein
MGIAGKKLSRYGRVSAFKDDAVVLEEGLIDNSSPLYNSRITRVYVEYLLKKYPAIDVDEILQYAGMTKPELEDPAHWFSQDQVDRFNFILTQKTGNESISREVGRFATTSEVLGIFKKIAISLVNPTSIYMLLGKFYSLLSRAVVVETKRVADTKVEVMVTPSPGVREKAYQCQNRIGTFEGIGKHFSDQYAQVDHPQCIHRGDATCLYTLTWEMSRSLIWLRLKNISVGASILLSIVLTPFVPLTTWLTISLLLGLMSSWLHIYSQHLKNLDLSETIKAQGDIAEQHLEGIRTQYNSSLLIEEIGNATSTLMDTRALLDTVANVMQNRLSYDRGMLLLANSKGNSLEYAAGYGFDPHEKALLHLIHFRLDNPASKGLFTKTFHAQKPYIVHDINELKHHFSSRSQRLVNLFKPSSLVCVPIVYERQSLGVLVVDNKFSKNKLQQSDLNLLKGIAANIATSINNSISYNKLIESEEKYRDMFENVSDFLYFHDLEGRLLEANNSFRSATGYSEATLTQMNFRDLVPAEYGAQYEAYLHDIMHTGSAEGVSRILTKDGGNLILEYKNSLILEDGNPVGVRGSARDITERWKARKEKKRLQGMLDRAKKMEAVGTLAGGVAHDLNNILSGIVSYPELILMDLPEHSELRDPLSCIMDSGQKASALVQDLLTMARRGVTAMEIINLNDIINEYRSSPEFAKIVKYHPAVNCRVNLDSKLLNIEGSSIHLFKTLMNLVANAAEAMTEGGELIISSRNQYVDQAIKGFDNVAEGDYTVLSVSDTGIGITKKDQKHIFEPFYTKKIMGRSGTGLGMSVVWATVKDHKGQIDIASQIGEGTTINLYFPATRKEKLSRGDVIAMDQCKGDGESLLVVDDVPTQREIASLMLTKLGYHVATVPSGERAVEYLKNRQADLVILDMIMEPGIDGLETFKRMRKINPNQRTIIVSGYSDSAKVKQAQKIGAGAYIKKPYVLKDIGMAVRTALDHE